MHSKRGSRILWILLLAAHAPALVAACASLAGGGSSTATAIWRILSVGAASAFFILKIRDVSWLRWRSGRRSIVVLTVAVALLHTDALRRAVAFESAADAGVWQVAMLAGGVSLLAPAIQRRLEGSAQAGAAVRLATRFARFSDNLVPKIRFTQLFTTSRTNRAPPALAV